MVVKEKNEALYTAPKKAIKKTNGQDKRAFILKWTEALFCGAVFSLSGGFIPISAALAAALPTAFSAAVFAGSAVSVLAFRQTGDVAAQLLAAAVILALKILFRNTEKIGSKAVGTGSAVVYIISGFAASIASEITAALAAAVMFRGVICGVTAYFISCEANELKEKGKLGISGEKSLCTAALYVVGISAMFCVSIGNFSLGRTAGIFVILAAGGRFGGAGGAVMSALTSLGAILGDSGSSQISELSRSMAVIGCAGLAGGVVSKRGRTVSAVVFTLATLFLTLFMGKLSWAASLMTDTLTAAALYALIPDRIYMKLFNTAVSSRQAVTEYLGKRIELAADCFSEIGKGVDKACEILAKKNYIQTDIGEAVCGRICRDCRNRDFCCRSDEERIKTVFRPSEKLLLMRSFITARDLPRSIDGCTKREEIAELMNRLFSQNYELCRTQEGHLREKELLAEQMMSLVGYMKRAGDICSDGKIYDENYSARVCGIIHRAGGNEPCAAVFFDKRGNLFISAFYKGRLCVPSEKITEKLTDLTDRELDAPEFFPSGEFTRVCWHEEAPFAAEVGKAVLCGRESVSGDSSAVFSDGFGVSYFIIADGMGSGSRAAIESSMACSLISRLIKAGADELTALRTVNTMLISKSADEVFTTVDMLKIDLFSGKAEFFKAGAADSFVRTGGAVRSIGNDELPLGIIPLDEPKPISVRLSDGDCAAIFSDGIPEENLPRLRELMLSDGYSPSRCADTVVELNHSENDPFADDRTIIVVKLHKLE